MPLAYTNPNADCWYPIMHYYEITRHSQSMMANYDLDWILLGIPVQNTIVVMFLICPYKTFTVSDFGFVIRVAYLKWMDDIFTPGRSSISSSASSKEHVKYIHRRVEPTATTCKYGQIMIRSIVTKE